MIPSNVIFPFDGLNSAIPAGWERVTSLDNKYPKAWGTVAPDNTGGSDTHSHTSPTHTHTMISHIHAGYTTRDGVYESDGGDTSNLAARDSHIHNYSISGVSGGSLANAITYASVNSLSPYYAVIFIKPSGTLGNVAEGILAYFNKLTNPSNWKLCDGNAGAPDIRGKYLRGAGTGANAGGTGGVTTHSHTLNHTHTNISHTHSGTSGGNSDGGRNASVGGLGGDVVANNHTHTINLTANTAEASSAYSGSGGSAESIDLAYKKMAIFKNFGGGMIRGMVAMWLGATADIPVGWFLCDGNNGTVNLKDKFVKAGDDITQNGNTGGSNTHTHAATNSHTHTATGTHTHTGTAVYISAPYHTGSGGDGASKDHSHTVDTCSSPTSTWNSTTISANSSDHQPAYRTVAYIEFQFEAGGSFLYNLV